MSNIKPEQAFAKHKVKSFGGMETPADLHPEVAADVRNFRILANGKLEKRYGWYELRTLTDKVRGVWQGELGGEHCIFLAVGSTACIWRNNLGVSKVGDLSSTEGEVSFVRFGDRLYLLDGTEILIYDADSFSFVTAQGYAPLYGHNWHPSALGDVREPRNLLSRRLRVHYLNTPGTNVFYLPFFAESVDLVRVNNLTRSDYTFVPNSDHVALSQSQTGDIVEIAFTVSGESDAEAELRAVGGGYLHRIADREELFLFGSPAAHRLYRTKSLSEVDLNGCKVFYDDADRLYVPEENVFLVSDREHPVTALVAHLDRILVFSTNATFSLLLDEKTDEAHLYPILHGFGCATKNAALAFEGDVITVAENGIFRLSATVSDPDRLRVTALSDRILGLLNPTLFKNAILFHDRRNREVWIRNKTESSEGLVWVWNGALDMWYRFDDIHASLFFENEGEAAFARENKLYQFDRDFFIDGGHDYDAFYQSGFLDFSRADALKRTVWLGACISAETSAVQATLESESASHSRDFESGSETSPLYLDLRVAMGRFRYLRYRIVCRGSRPCILHRAELFCTL